MPTTPSPVPPTRIRRPSVLTLLVMLAAALVLLVLVLVAIPS
jgi:hypothetical protein